jgi:class 3 adenylate cyclase
LTLTTQPAPAESFLAPKPTRRALLLIDVAGSLRITRQLGDARAYHVLRFLTSIISDFPTNTGRVVRSLGDGYLLVFDTVDDALAHAAAAQAAVERCNPTEVPIKIRCAIHEGDVLEADNDVFGLSVYLVSRVCGHAHGGEILVTGAARDASNAAENRLADFGPTLLPGFEDPVRVYEYSWR